MFRQLLKNCHIIPLLLDFCPNKSPFPLPVTCNRNVTVLYKHVIISYIIFSCASVGRESFNEKVLQAASKGFTGCLSSVQFNHVAPLKAALTNRGSSLVTIRGPLVQSNCGALAESTSHTLQGKTLTHSSVWFTHTHTHTSAVISRLRQQLLEYSLFLLNKIFDTVLHILFFRPSNSSMMMLQLSLKSVISWHKLS